MPGFDIMMLGMGLVKSLGEAPPPTLFHYTSPAALLGIVESKSFWATRVNHTNDRDEYVLALRRFTELLKQQAGPDGEQKLLAYAEHKVELLAQRPDFYIVSLTEEPDQLSQWRAYTPPAGGYCLGLRSERLEACARSKTYLFGRCVYSKEEQRELMMRLIRPALDEVRQGCDPLATGMSLVTAVVLLACFIKDDSFEEEKEWRIACGPLPIGCNAIQFRCARGYLVPYVSVKLAEDKEPLDLESVSIGPAPEPGMLEQGLKALLQARSIGNCAIRSTRTPYRNW